MAHHINKKTIISGFRVVFYLYIVFMIYILFFIPSRIGTYNNINLIPFNTIIRYFKYFHLFTFSNWFLNIFGNIIIFIPFGIILPIIRPYFNKLWKVLIITLIVTMAVEVIQHLTLVGELDVDDIILNTAGATMGYILLNLTFKLTSRK